MTEKELFDAMMKAADHARDCEEALDAAKRLSANAENELTLAVRNYEGRK